MSRRMRRIRKEINENIVIGEIMGGLGNQLFIIFTTIAYALENNLDYKIRINERKRKTYFDTPLYKNLEINNEMRLRIYQEKDHGFNKIEAQKNIILRGYFQSYKYFENKKEEIIKLLDWHKLRDGIKEKYKSYLDCDGFIHFRLGDYKNLDCHPVCDIDYYIDALSNLKGNLNILYFFEEEDRKEVEEKIEILKKRFINIQFIPIDTNIIDYEQVFIMSFLKYCIIANSTFSWWGAYLNERQDKEIYYPNTWFSGSLKNLNIKDKLPNSWKKISKIKISKNIVILINIGNYQEYTNDNIDNLLKYNNNIILIIDRCMFQNVTNKDKITLIYSDEFDLEYFEKKNKLDNKFRNGFWKNTSKRLFYLYELIKKYNIKNCYHLENDVLLYTDINDILIPNKKIYLTMDAKDRCIPGIIYIPESSFLKVLIDEYNYSQNDMINMSTFFWKHPELCDTFPIIKENSSYDKKDIFNKNFNKFNAIFDAASIGQYLGGVDPKNIPGDTRGFINETCVVNYSKYKIIWNNKKPYLIINDEEIPILNLHIHCKNLKAFIN